MPIKPMRICLVTNEFPGLTETFITTKALDLRKRGHEVTVIKNQENNEVNASHVQLVKQAGIKVLRFDALQSKKTLLKALLTHPSILLKSSSFAGIKNNLKQRLQIQVLNKYPFDIVHFEFSGLGVAYEKAIDNKQYKVVVSCRGTAEKVKTVTEPKRKEQLRKLFVKANGVHCVSQDMADTVAPYCDDPQKIFVNRPSIDADIFRRAKPYRVNEGVLQILTIGRFTFQKGYLIGLMAMRKLKDEGILFKWTIVGDGPQREEILYHIHALGLSDCVQLAGKKNRDEILTLYNQTDVFLLTSVYEGIANVCLEAMGMELPVVSTKSGGMDEVIEHGKNGLLCEVYQPDAIAENLKMLAKNAVLRKELGVNARTTVIEKFTISRQVDVFEEQYLKLLKEN
jgi:colanic acid/amylovoran biosynthesis glycosyltransferase